MIKWYLLLNHFVGIYTVQSPTADDYRSYITQSFAYENKARKGRERREKFALWPSSTSIYSASLSMCAPFTRPRRGGGLNGQQQHAKWTFPGGCAEMDNTAICGVARGTLWLLPLTMYLLLLLPASDFRSRCAYILALSITTAILLCKYTLFLYINKSSFQLGFLYASIYFYPPAGIRRILYLSDGESYLFICGIKR